MARVSYSPEILARAQDYLERYEQLGDAFPSQVGLARFLGITRMTVNNWKRDETKPEWGELIDRISDEQERVCLNKGITGTFNSVITKLVLAKHGYHDKAAVEHSGPDGGPIQNEVTTIERRIVDP